MYGKDLTKGNLKKNMILLLIPLIFSNLLISIYSIIDGIYVGKLIGESGVSAITNCFPLILIFFSILEGILVAASVITSQLFGGKEEQKLKEFIGVLYLFTFFVATITSMIMIFFSNFWLRLLGTPNEIFEITKKYIIIYSIGSIFNYISVIIGAILKAVGNSKTPLILAGISISMLAGDNSILEKAGDAKESTEKGKIVEQAKIDILGKLV